MGFKENKMNASKADPAFVSCYKSQMYAITYNCERSELSSLFNGTDFSIYIFQAVRRAVNVLNVSTCI